MTEVREDPLPPDGRVEPAETSKPETLKSGSRPAPVFGRGALVALLVWGLAVLAVTAGIAGATAFWWVVPLIGAAVPITLVMVQNRPPHNREDLGEIKVRELLDALREHGELTPTTAAMLTTLTVSEASEILESLARTGHLEAQDGHLVYALRESDRRGLGLAPTAQPETELLPAQASPPRQPDEPLSEREIEVLKLIASGRTNREIAQELFVALGTVKAHVNNVYRKLGARNRADAVSTARSLNLLD